MLQHVIEVNYPIFLVCILIEPFLLIMGVKIRCSN